MNKAFINTLLKPVLPCLIASLVGGAMASIATTRLLTRSWGTVDMNALVASQVRTLPQGNKPTPAQIRKLAENLKQHLNTFARSRDLVLLAKGAVMASRLPDFTQEILTQLNREASS
jgi:hypothetical protein